MRVIIKETHRGLWYEDGVFKRVLEPGRYSIFPEINLLVWRAPKIDVVAVDVRQRELTIKGQEILTADKVALRVSIIVQFRVTDPRAAMHEVASYDERLYSDVQLAARRSLASMNLEEILTNRNRLSEDIQAEVKEAAGGYGVAILRADVKDLIFPGNLQEIMNRVLAAERNSQAQLVDARTKSELARIQAASDAETQKLQAQTRAETERITAEAAAEALQIKAEAENKRLQSAERAAQLYRQHPALVRMQELETLRELGRNGQARLYVSLGNGEPHRSKDD